MRNFFFCLVIAGVVISGCIWQQPMQPESNFFRGFSLTQTVEKMKVPELQFRSGGNSSGASPGETTNHRQDFNLVYKIEERNETRFDETKFISQLKDAIEKEMNAAGVRENGSGTGNESLDFDYSKENHEGWIEVIGARVEGNEYKLWCVIRERTKKAKE